MAHPTIHREVRGFFGLADYYRKFVQNFGKIIMPLHQLLTLDTFEWTDSAQDAFLNLKPALTIALVLGLPDFAQPFVVECVKPGKDSIFLKKGKTIISVGNWKFSRSRIKKRTSPLNSSYEI